MRRTSTSTSKQNPKLGARTTQRQTEFMMWVFVSTIVYMSRPWFFFRIVEFPAARIASTKLFRLFSIFLLFTLVRLCCCSMFICFVGAWVKVYRKMENDLLSSWYDCRQKINDWQFPPPAHLPFPICFFFFFVILRMTSLVLHLNHSEKVLTRRRYAHTQFLILHNIFFVFSFFWSV